MNSWSWSKPERGYAERTPRAREKREKSTESKTQEKKVKKTAEKTTEITYDKKKRDHTAERLAERQYIPQISRNPYLELLNDCEGAGHVQMYIHDLSQQDEFMIPKNSNTKN
jgi:hypothetical protein